MSDRPDDICSCIRELQKACEKIIVSPSNRTITSSWGSNNEMGKMLYTISILIMFSMVIILLMVRSIRRSHSAIEMDALLDAMRFREELDIQERQRRRLLKAKNKVTAWLTRTNGGTKPSRGWRSSPQLIVPRKQTSSGAVNNLYTSPYYLAPQYSPRSSASDIPEIVVTDDGPSGRRAHTPCLSLIYDFNERKDSVDSAASMRTGPRASVCSAGSASGSLHRGSFSLDEPSQGRLSETNHSLSLG